MAQLWQFRPMRPSDIAFVRNAWLMSYSEFAAVDEDNEPPRVSWDIYLPEQNAQLDRILNRSGVIVACGTEDDGHLFGFVCFEKQERRVIHFVYVKDAFRHLGMCKSLLGEIKQYVGEGPMWVTHWTRKAGKIFDRADYNPYRRDYVRQPLAA